MSEWGDAFLFGLQWSQTAMLIWAGWLLMDGVRLTKRSTKIIDAQQKVIKEMLDLIYFQHGILTVMQAGVAAPHNLQPIDLRNLPIEIRLKIWHALIDVGMELHNAHERQAGGRAEKSKPS